MSSLEGIVGQLLGFVAKEVEGNSKKNSFVHPTNFPFGSIEISAFIVGFQL